jgi:hypothetical protein
VGSGGRKGHRLRQCETACLSCFSKDAFRQESGTGVIRQVEIVDFTGASLPGQGSLAIQMLCSYRWYSVGKALGMECFLTLLRVASTRFFPDGNLANCRCLPRNQTITPTAGLVFKGGKMGLPGCHCARLHFDLAFR